MIMLRAVFITILLLKSKLSKIGMSKLEKDGKLKVCTI
jgi:hypothetical protein